MSITHVPRPARNRLLVVVVADGAGGGDGRSGERFHVGASVEGDRLAASDVAPSVGEIDSRTDQRCSNHAMRSPRPENCVVAGGENGGLAAGSCAGDERAGSAVARLVTRSRRAAVQLPVPIPARCPLVDLGLVRGCCRPRPAVSLRSTVARCGSGVLRGLIRGSSPRPALPGLALDGVGPAGDCQLAGADGRPAGRAYRERVKFGPARVLEDDWLLPWVYVVVAPFLQREHDRT